MKFLRHQPLRLYVLLVSGFMTVAPIFAAAMPQTSGRVEEVLYDSKEVIAVSALIGFAVHIALDPTERIESAAIGDAEHWAVTARDGTHDIFLKPRPGAVSTNLAIRTDQRSYSLSLAVIKTGVPTFRVDFRYPTTHTQIRPSINRRYSMQVGRDSARIAPSQAYDDEHFTYLSFAPHAEFPAVFEVQDDGSERLVNHHTENDTLIVHTVAPKLVLRLGSAVVNVLRDEALPESTSKQEQPVDRLQRVDRAGFVP